MTNQQLDEAVAKARWNVVMEYIDVGGGTRVAYDKRTGTSIRSVEAYHPSTSWEQAGELLEEMGFGAGVHLNLHTGWIGEFMAPDGIALTEPAMADTPQRAICLAYIEYRKTNG